MFKVGDKVHSKHFGYGKVTIIDKDNTIKAVFDSRLYERYFGCLGQYCGEEHNESKSINLVEENKDDKFDYMDSLIKSQRNLINSLHKVIDHLSK